MAEGQIEVKQVRSAIGVKPKHRGTLRALGLGRVGQKNVLPDRPEIRGMVARVVHLVEVSDGSATDRSQTNRSPTDGSRTERSAVK
jgi:large subunit ribosomal protein L30